MREQGVDVVSLGGRQHQRIRYREHQLNSAQSEDRGMHGKLHAREPGDPSDAR